MRTLHVVPLLLLHFASTARLPAQEPDVLTGHTLRIQDASLVGGPGESRGRLLYQRGDTVVIQADGHAEPSLWLLSPASQVSLQESSRSVSWFYGALAGAAVGGLAAVLVRKVLDAPDRRGCERTERWVPTPESLFGSGYWESTTSCDRDPRAVGFYAPLGAVAGALLIRLIRVEEWVDVQFPIQGHAFTPGAGSVGLVVKIPF